MSHYDELVFLHQLSTPCHLASLAKSAGFRVRVVKQVSELAPELDSYSFYFIAQQGAALDKHGIPLIVPRLLPHVPVALYLIKSHTLDPESALLQGIRGLLFADQSQERLLIGLHKIINDELWYDRRLISKVFRYLLNNKDQGVEQAKATIGTMKTLTSRERSVIQWVAKGARNKEIADALFISEHTVKSHVSSIFRKTGSRNRVELLRWLNRSSLISADKPVD